LRILVDTACWLWILTDPKRFSPRTRRLLVSPETKIHLSAASAWEIAIKYALGKLPLPAQPAAYVPRMMRETQTLPLLVDVEHALRVAELPLYHRDPFDRLLIAQAQVEKFSLLTADTQFEPYEVELMSP
jgi:PIN domain nuclease of toxin-antitoxin system